MSVALPPARRTSTLRGRLLALLVAAGVVLGLVLTATGLVFAHLVDVQRTVTVEYFDAITRATTAFVQLVDAETAVRGYALTGDPVTLEPYERARASDVDFATVAEEVAATAEDDELVRLSQDAAQAAQRWHDEFAAPMIAQIEADGHESVQPAQIEEGKELFDETRAAAEAYLDRLQTIRAHGVDELDRWTRIASSIVAVLVLAAIAVGILLWVALKRWVVEPVDALAADARAVSSGDLEHAVEATGPGEIATLAADVESMRVALVAQVQAHEASRAEIAAAHEQLTEQAEELRRSNRDLEQFAYVASHDLQEPLRKVASFTQLLQKRYGGQLDERADQYIDFAVDGAKRMQRLIQDLLGFSRVGRVGGEVTDVDLGSALRGAIDNLEEAIAEAGAEVTRDELPVVRGEAALLVQLFQNLVGNAVKFRHPDRAPRVHLSAQRVDDAWQLECRDNGIGIDAQYADRVFVIFQRLHAKDVYEGTGIGLALCKKIVEFHGGRIWIESHDGEGTSIRWTLPDRA
ncbi:sensor histidine kinase [Cellulomonas chitinilytica]|uniref:sensor histidine kinase n=1 Tax=Cellulomonas chitinilytica TaxID=398759 RepID=UPI003570EA75